MKLHSANSYYSQPTVLPGRKDVSAADPGWKPEMYNLFRREKCRAVGVHGVRL